ncbi:hypothetical protein DFP73DRAFT_618317 [Morchella snyderi]|nr:hypothetical protein DFP73DRAFT_618317 [Morchella snyderi]
MIITTITTTPAMSTPHPQYQTIPLLPVSLALTALALYLHTHYPFLPHIVLIAFYTTKLTVHYAVADGALSIAEDITRIHGAAMRERWNTALGILQLGAGVGAVLWGAVCAAWGVLDWVFRGYYILDETAVVPRVQEGEDEVDEDELVFRLSGYGDRFEGEVEVMAGEEKIVGRFGPAGFASVSPSSRMMLVVFDPAMATTVEWRYRPRLQKAVDEICRQTSTGHNQQEQPPGVLGPA